MKIFKQIRTGHVCTTVGELKKAISDIDDGLAIVSGFEQAVSVLVMENESDVRDVHLQIEESDEISFSQWCFILDRIATQNGQVGSLIEQTGKASWKEAFENGTSPDDAFKEMCEYE